MKSGIGLRQMTPRDRERRRLGGTSPQRRVTCADRHVSDRLVCARLDPWPGAEHGVGKLAADAQRGTLIGASLMGPAAGELLGSDSVPAKTSQHPNSRSRRPIVKKVELDTPT